MRHSEAYGGRELHRGCESLQKWIQESNLRRSFGERLLGNWIGYWFDRHLGMTESLVREVTLPDDPIFIIGLWRTGSTRLHDRLTETGEFTTPTTWQCFNPASFLLQPKPIERRELKRPMDESVISTHSPQEDEFAALLLGENSVYRSFLDPCNFTESTALLEAWHTSSLSPRWETFLKGVLLQRPGRLLLKSPSHTFRLPWLALRFPKAQFVCLQRNLPAVAESMQRTWRLMASHHGRSSLDEAGLQIFIETSILQYQSVMAWARTHLGGRLVQVEHEEAIQENSQWIDRLIESLLKRDA